MTDDIPMFTPSSSRCFPPPVQAQRGVRGQQPLRVAPGVRLHRQPDQTAAAGQAVRAGAAAGGESPDLPPIHEPIRGHQDGLMFH